MGKSAKIHKRTKKKTSNSAGPSTTLTAPTPAVQATASASTAAAAAKKGAKLKGNKRAKLRSASSTARGHHGHVLGGADYVDILMGSRRRAREEALKLPRDTESPPPMCQ